MAFQSPNRRHNRQYFYKYMTAEVAKIVLVNRTMRWSSPLLFNDPFDVPRSIKNELDTSVYRHALEKEFSDILEENREVNEPRIKFIQDMLNRHGDADLIAHVVKELRSSQAAICNERRSPFNELEEHLNKLLREFRILCLSEDKNSAPMWNHYADQYRGVVLRLTCVDVNDSPLLAAERVTYQNGPQPFFLLDNWIKSATGQLDTPITELFRRSWYVKNSSWKYEKEWRVVSFARPGDTGLFYDYRFVPRDLSAIYFGKDISGQDKDDILALLAHGLEHVEVYQAYIDPNKGAFGFIREG